MTVSALATWGAKLAAGWVTPSRQFRIDAERMSVVLARTT